MSVSLVCPNCKRKCPRPDYLTPFLTEDVLEGRGMGGFGGIKCPHCGEPSSIN